MTSTSSSTPQLPVGSQGQPITVIGNKYRLSRRLGGGSFGDIYLGEYIPTGEKVSAAAVRRGSSLLVRHHHPRGPTDRSIDQPTPHHPMAGGHQV